MILELLLGSYDTNSVILINGEQKTSPPKILQCLVFGLSQFSVLHGPVVGLGHPDGTLVHTRLVLGGS